MINKGVIILILLALTGIIIFLSFTISSLKEDLSVSQSNIKAFDRENSGLINDNRVFKFTIGQLKSLNDSIIIKLREVQTDLGLKDSKIKTLQYILSEGSRGDTITFTDTIFNNTFVAFDTTLGDRWFNTKIGLRYPGTVTVNPSFISELYIFTSSNREPVNPRKKFFLWRLFQKKHTVYIIDIKDKNPYVELKKSRFIEIVK